MSTNHVGKYHIGQKIYEGGHTTVYRGLCEDAEKGQQSAIIKILKSDYPSPELLARFRNEYQLLNNLGQAGTVAAYSLEPYGHSLAILMEDFGTCSLQQLLEQGPLDLKTFFTIALQLIEALEFIHCHHIIHKDLNPPNILWDAVNQRIKIIDFGISSTLSQEGVEMQSIEALEGRLPYISPEQTGRLNRALDYRSDFYSLGITLYEMLTGQVPFTSEDTLELVHCHLVQVPESVCMRNPDVPPMLAEIIAKLLAKMPEDRYLSITGLKADLLTCQTQWQQQGEVRPFKLGQQDVYSQLLFSQKLYGREEQVAQLLATFERVRHHQSELLLVAGYSGIGKTSLVKEIYKSITQERGYFVSGKYDQLTRAKPYTAIIEALQELIRSLLTQSDEYLNSLKNQLLAALGDNGQIMIDLIPSLALIIGEQPAVIELPQGQAQNRFTIIFQRFIRVLAQANHPLVIFLDDLQWADSASLQLIQLLITDTDVRHLLIIGAYRDNEITPDHPLLYLKQQLEKVDIEPTTLTLATLKYEDVKELLEDSLNLRQEKSEELTKLVLSKTQGNPFFINEFLKKLYRDKLLQFSAETHEWEWDLKKIDEQAITSNVVDLLLGRINQLSINTKNILELAACVGHVFDIATLQTISQKPLTDIVSAIEEASQEMLIAPVQDSHRLLEGITLIEDVSVLTQKIRYRFIHDRIQQAAYQLIAEPIKQSVQLKIGRLLLEQQPLQEKDDRLFIVLNHINNALPLITDIEERVKIARYNLWAGQKAKASMAYEAAKGYLQAGIFLLESNYWKNDPALFFDLSKELAACQYLTGEFDKADAGFKKLLKEASAVLSRSEVYQLNCGMLGALGKHKEAVELGLKGLAELGIKVPAKPKKLYILKSVIKLYFKIGEHPEKQDLPQMTSPKYLSIINVINAMNSSAYMLDKNLCVVLSCIVLELSLKHGYSIVTFSCGLVYIAILLHKLKAYKRAINSVEFLNKLGERYGLGSSKGRTYIQLGAGINPWCSPLTECLENVIKAYHAARDEGNLQVVFIAGGMMAAIAFISGMPFLETKKYLDSVKHLVKKANMQDSEKVLNYVEAAFLSLMNPNIDLKKFFVQFEKEKFPHKGTEHVRGAFYSVYAKVFYILEQFNEASIASEYAQLAIKKTIPTVVNIEACLFYGLTLLSPASVTAKAIRGAKKIRKLLTQWTDWYPTNFKQFLLLLNAEIARAENKNLLAMQLYRDAIVAAEDQQNSLLAAIANECAGRLYLSVGLTDTAKIHFLNAHYIYQSWGATAKCKLLEEHHPQWFEAMAAPAITTSATHTITRHATSTQTSSHSIDMLSLLKSTQIIAGEIQLDKLLQKLLIILLQDAGAERCVLLVKDEDEWYVQAEGTVTAQKIYVALTERIDQRSDLPLSLVRYVQRTNENLVLQSLKELKVFMGEDTYLSSVMPQSVLMAPISYQGQLQNLLYLENKAISHAFTAERVHILQVISSQAAISLENARLYYQATHDPLTGLANRNLLYQVFNLSVNRAKRNNGIIAILFLDLDGFKKINDTLGHEVGDKLLIYFAEQLQAHLRDTDLAVRLGGDEFVAMLEDIELREVNRIAERLLAKLKDPVTLLGHEINIASSIGISLYPHDAEDITKLLKQADVALYRVKSKGKGHHQFYTTRLDLQVKEENQREIDLRQALEKNELDVFYQPVYDTSGEISYFEALMRWHHPKLGLLTANKFISTAERTELILSLGEWVINEVARQIQDWLKTGKKVIPIAINISGVQFKKQSISNLFAKVLQETKIDPKYLEIEFTESIFIEPTEQILAEIMALKNLGIKLTLDDFGTGYSSLNYLCKFPVDKIKIDQSFIQNIEHNEKARELILAIITIAHSLKVAVVAEGVETQQQLIFLQESKVDKCQGYYLSYPLDANEATGLLDQS